MSKYSATVSVMIVAASLAEVTAAVVAMSDSYDVSYVGINKEDEPQAQTGVQAAVQAEVSAAANTAIKAAATKTTKTAKATPPAPAPAPVEPDPLDAAPAPAPAAPAKTAAELLADLRAFLTPISGRDAAGRASVVAFVTSYGKKMITEFSGEELPAVIEAAKAKLS